MARLVTFDEFTAGARPQGGSIAELVIGEITNLISRRRPAMNVLGSEDVSNTFVELQTDDLASRAHNAAVEGAQFTNPSLTQPTRHFVHVQSFAKWGEVSDEQSMVRHYGMSDPFTYQGVKKMQECLNDIEHTLHRGSAATGETDVSRQFGGFLNVASSDVFTSSSGTTLTEEVFIDLLQRWRDQNYDIRPTIAFVNSYLKRTVTGYTTKVTRNVDVDDRRQVLNIERHESDFGSLDIMHSEDQLLAASKTAQGNSIVFIDPEHLMIGWLRRPMVEPLSRAGFSNRFQINAQCTLIYKHPVAMGGGTGFVSLIP